MLAFDGSGRRGWITLEILAIALVVLFALPSRRREEDDDEDLLGDEDPGQSQVLVESSDTAASTSPVAVHDVDSSEIATQFDPSSVDDSSAEKLSDPHTSEGSEQS